MSLCRTMFIFCCNCRKCRIIRLRSPFPGSSVRQSDVFQKRSERSYGRNRFMIISFAMKPIGSVYGHISKTIPRIGNRIVFILKSDLGGRIRSAPTGKQRIVGEDGTRGKRAIYLCNGALAKWMYLPVPLFRRADTIHSASLHYAGAVARRCCTSSTASPLPLRMVDICRGRSYLPVLHVGVRHNGALFDRCVLRHRRWRGCVEQNILRGRIDFNQFAVLGIIP